MEKSYIGWLPLELRKEFLLSVAPEAIDTTCESDEKLRTICDVPGFWFLKAAADLNLKVTERFSKFFNSYMGTEKEKYIRALAYKKIYVPGSENFVSAYECLKDAIKKEYTSNSAYFLQFVQFNDKRTSKLCQLAAKHKRYDLLEKVCHRGRAIPDASYLAYLYRDGRDELAEEMVTSKLHRNFQKLRGLAMKGEISKFGKLEDWEVCQLTYTLIKYKRIKSVNLLLKKTDNFCRIEVIAGLIRQKSPNLDQIKTLKDGLAEDSYQDNLFLFQEIGKTGSVEIFKLFVGQQTPQLFILIACLEHCDSSSQLFSYLLTYDFPLMSCLRSFSNDLPGFTAILKKMEERKEAIPPKDKFIGLEGARLLKGEVLPL